MSHRMIMIGGWTDIYAKAKHAGFHLTLVQLLADIKPDDLAMVDQIISSELSDKLVLDIASAIHQKQPFDVVISFSELGLLNAALIQERLDIAGNPLAPVLLTRDKANMRQHMKVHGIPSIPHALVTCAEDAVRFGDEFGWPIILKPSNGVGSRQIHKLFSGSDAAPAMDAIRNDVVTAGVIKHDFPTQDVLVEKFIEGEEVSVEAISWDGHHTVLGITDKLTTGYPRFVETGHTMPSALPLKTQAAIRSMVLTFLESIGHRYGPSHTEVIVSPVGPIIVESHTRTGGDRIFEMVDLAYGVDMFSATLNGFAGKFPEINVCSQNGAAIRYITVTEGLVRAINGLDAMRTAPGVVRCELTFKVGDHLSAFTDSTLRHGYVLATGVNRKEAVENVERALSLLVIEVDTANA